MGGNKTFSLNWEEKVFWLSFMALTVSTIAYVTITNDNFLKLPIFNMIVVLTWIYF
jgi:hypothetical protein